MEPKSPKRRPKQGRKLKKYVLTIKKPRRISFWNRITNGNMILVGEFHPSRLSVVKNQILCKKTPAMCIVAPIYSKLKIKSQWIPSDLTKIQHNGNELHGKTKLNLKLTNNEDGKLRPNCIYPTFLVENHHVSVLISDICLTGRFKSNEMMNDLQKLIKTKDAIIFTCHDKIASFWYLNGKYHCYCPPAQIDGKLSEITFITRNKMLRPQIMYLQEHLNLRGKFTIYCIKILKLQKIPLNINQLLVKHRKLVHYKSESGDTPTDKVSILDDSREQSTNLTEAKSDIHDQDKNFQLFELPFSRDYANKFYDDRGFLSASSFVRDIKKILHVNIAAALFLYHLRAIFWRKETMDDIINFGIRLFEDSEKLELEDHEIWSERVATPIQFGNKLFDIVYEKIVFGDITTEETNIFNFRQGILAFFKHNDVGLILGPQCQLIWQETGLYYTFSAKERDAVGRKWTKLLATQLESITTGKRVHIIPVGGAACVSWFKTPLALADAYISNIELKHRKDSYRIVKLKCVEIVEKSEDFNNWISIAENKWRIIGDKTICNFISDTHRGGFLAKAFCIGCANSLYGLIINVSDWDSKAVDDILTFGNDYYLESVELKPNLANHFETKDLKKTFTMLEKRFQVLIIICPVAGSVFYTKKDSGDLFEGMKLFFEDYQYGVLVVRDMALPIWADNTYFYLFFPYDKLFGKTDVCFCSPDNIYSQVHGHAYVLRFKILKDMHEEILNCLCMEDNDKYCIHSVEGKDRPPLLNYSKFGENGAKIEPFNKLHEGHVLFNVRADKQTYANLIISLCFATITRPLEWNKDDLLDILKIGDAIYCRLAANLTDCQEVFFEMNLNQVDPMIGTNKFTFTQNAVSAVFKFIPEQPEEGDEETEGSYADYDTNGPYETENPMVLDLKGVLDSWEAAETIYAILESPFFKVALWKKDLVYFIFDPKESDEDGKLSSKRLTNAITRLEGGADENVPEEITEQSGSAYVAYFYDLESFLEHILSKVPEEYMSESLTLNTITIKSLKVPVADLERKKSDTPASFRSLSPNVAIIRASISQDETMFKHSNLQEAANCMASLAFAYIFGPTKWSVDLLDVILKYGDRLYIKSMEAIKIKNPAKGCSSDKLTLEEIIATVNIFKIKFRFSIISKFTNCLGSAPQNPELKRFLAKLNTIENGFGTILRAKSYTNAIWRSGNTYFLFDPHHTDPDGYVSNQGPASLCRFNRSDPLVNFVTQKFLCISGSNSFEILTIEISKSLPAGMPSIFLEKFNFTTQLPANQAVFVDIGNGMRVLKKNIESSETAIPKDFLCLAALLNSKLEFVELWNYSVFKKITLMGYYLLKQLNCKRINEFEDDEKHLEEINFSINIDNVLCNIVVNHVIQATVLPEEGSNNLHLKQGLENFFLDRKIAIITGTNRSYALWAEGPHYYMFWTNETLGKVMVQSANDWSVFYKIIISEADLVLPTNAYQIKYVQICKINIWDACEKSKSSRGFNKAVGQVDAIKDPIADICRECNFEEFKVQTSWEKRVAEKFRKNFVPFMQGIEMLVSCDILGHHKFFNSENYFPNIKATCLVAAGMSFIKDPSFWTRKTISKIIQSGNELFMNSVAVSRTNDLEITDMEQAFNLYNVSLQIVALPPKKEVAERDNLVTVLTYVLRKHKTAYMICPNNFCFTFILRNCDCYLFYPGSMEKFLENPKTESSCLIRFDSLTRAVTFILNKKHIDGSCFYIGPVIVMGRF